MRNKFTDENSPGYHPIRKVKVVFAGLSFAVRHGFSVAYKVVLSLVLVVVSAALQRWVDFVVIVPAAGVVLTAELFNSAVEGLCDFMGTGHDESEPSRMWRLPPSASASWSGWWSSVTRVSGCSVPADYDGRG
jgi:diacylglycerol kinase